MADNPKHTDSHRAEGDGDISPTVQDRGRSSTWFRLGIWIVSFSIPSLLVVAVPWIVTRFPESREVVYATTGAFVLVLLGSVLLRYLGDESHISTPVILETLSAWLGGTAKVDFSLSKDAFEYQRNLLERQAQLTRMLRELQVRTTSGPSTGIQLTEQERAKLAESITEQITGRSAADLLAAVEEKYGAALAQSAHLQDLRGHFERTRARLLSEVSALSRRSNLNLVIGALTTVAAVVVLAYIALNTELVVADWKAVLPSYLLRLSVVVFIEVFAFFFLRMYRSNLQDIKYFQNELTSIEAKFIALEAALANGESDTTGDVIRLLGQMERNVVLNPGQSTVELELLRGENQSLKSILDSVTGLVRK